MTTTTATPGFITGGVDTHLDVHVAAALDHLGGVLGTASFPTTSARYAQLLEWLQAHGPVERIGIEGTSSYGSGLAQYLRANGVSVIEVSRPSRQVRRRRPNRRQLVPGNATAARGSSRDTRSSTRRT